MQMEAMPNLSCCAANRVPSVARTPKGGTAPSSTDRPASTPRPTPIGPLLRTGSSKPTGRPDRRHQHILVAADQVPVPAARAGRGAKHSPPPALNYLTTPRHRHAAIDEVPQPVVEACRLGVEWLPVLGEPSEGDKHRRSL
jgi:hypothetical protein